MENYTDDTTSWRFRRCDVFHQIVNKNLPQPALSGLLSISDVIISGIDARWS